MYSVKTIASIYTVRALDISQAIEFVVKEGVSRNAILSVEQKDIKELGVVSCEAR